MIATELFYGINQDTAKTIISHGDNLLICKSGELYKKGFIGIIRKGTAKVIRTGSSGNSVTVRTMSDNDIFGAASIFGEWDETFSSILAQTDCEVIYFSEKVFKKMLITYPQFALNYIELLTDKIRFLNRRLDTFCAGNTQNKLYEYLLSQVDENGNVDIKISMSELAKRLGIGRTSLYRDISALEKAKLITRNGKKFIII